MNRHIHRKHLYTFFFVIMVNRTRGMQFQWQIIIFNHINRIIFIMSFILIFSVTFPLCNSTDYSFSCSPLILPDFFLPPPPPPTSPRPLPLLRLSVCLFSLYSQNDYALSWCHNLDHFYSLGWYLISFSGHSIPFRKLSRFLAAQNFVVAFPVSLPSLSSSSSSLTSSFFFFYLPTSELYLMWNYQHGKTKFKKWIKTVWCMSCVDI